MKRKKVIFSVLGILFATVIGGGIIGWRQYHKGRISLSDISPDVTVTAAQLYKAFTKDEQAANKKYLNKVILVNGTVTSVTKNSNENSVGLSAGKEAIGEISCQLSKGSTVPQTGETISLKGRCTGYLLDVMLVDAVIVKQ